MLKNIILNIKITHNLLWYLLVVVRVTGTADAWLAVIFLKTYGIGWYGVPDDGGDGDLTLFTVLCSLHLYTI